ncbi:hypothetical protein PIB30_022823 [Stylosanthes scabra]|uniref:Uncharacterized protein n=1 Tax=Stylosanthes scabra TaxID=79078 RepID=A0ABU6V7G3_9FABA|nr:hypothetical protein [Stylosanthes scabra]
MSSQPSVLDYMFLANSNGRVRPSEDFADELFEVQCARTKDEHFSFHKNLQCSSDLQGTAGGGPARPLRRSRFQLSVQFGFGGVRTNQFGFWALKSDHLDKGSVYWAYDLLGRLLIWLSFWKIKEVEIMRCHKLGYNVCQPPSSNLNRETDENGKPIVVVGNNYSCVKGEVRELSSWFLDTDSVEQIGDPSTWVREGKTTTSGLKNYFKNKSERGFSTSNAVKVEEGIVVSKPPEKKKVLSMKRRRAEEGGSGKKVIDLTSSKCCGKEVSLEEVKCITEKQKRLHGYVGEEDLTSVWSEHFPISVVAEEHFQSKTDLDLIDSVDNITRAQFMQVYAARLLCIGRYEELKAKEEAEQKKEKGLELQKALEAERKLEVATEQLVVKEKEMLELKTTIEGLKGKLQKFEKDKTELEDRVVELAVEKKEAEQSKADHGYDMMAAGFERARKQAEFFFPDLKFDQLNPIKVVHGGALIDDDEVDLEGGDDHDPKDGEE